MPTDDTAAPQPQPATYREIIDATREDRHALNEIFASLLKEQMTDAIYVLDEIIKHTPGDGRVNLERLRQSYKSRILNTGNRLLRELPKITEDFGVEQLRVYERVERRSAPYNPEAIPASAPSMAVIDNMHKRRPTEVRNRVTGETRTEMLARPVS